MDEIKHRIRLQRELDIVRKEKERIKELKKKIDNEYFRLDLKVIANLAHKDEEGFAFLTNINKYNLDMPFNLARRYGFKMPIFKVKQVEKRGKMTEDEYRQLLRNGEAIWVKEGLGVNNG